MSSKQCPICKEPITTWSWTFTPNPRNPVTYHSDCYNNRMVKFFEREAREAIWMGMDPFHIHTIKHDMEQARKDLIKARYGRVSKS